MKDHSKFARMADAGYSGAWKHPPRKRGLGVAPVVVALFGVMTSLAIVLIGLLLTS